VDCQSEQLWCAAHRGNYRGWTVSLNSCGVLHIVVTTEGGLSV